MTNSRHTISNFLREQGGFTEVLRVSLVLFLQGTCSNVPPLTGSSAHHLKMIWTEMLWYVVDSLLATSRSNHMMSDYYSDKISSCSGGTNTFFRGVSRQEALLAAILYCPHNFLIQNDRGNRRPDALADLHIARPTNDAKELWHHLRRGCQKWDSLTLLVAWLLEAVSGLLCDKCVSQMVSFSAL